MALTAGRWARGGCPVELLVGAFVERIHAEDEGGRLVARGVSWRDAHTGAVSSEAAHVVVLAAGAVESPRLWLSSGLPDPNGWVGRGLTYHHPEILIRVMPFYTGGSKGPRLGRPGRLSWARVDVPAPGGAGPRGRATSRSASAEGSLVAEQCVAAPCRRSTGTAPVPRSQPGSEPMPRLSRTPRRSELS
jgi:GMC oxidoreductase